jgi:hypothetical protein
MQFIAVALVALAGLASAAPGAPIEDRQTYVPCSGLYGSAQCCATDVLGVANLDCGTRKS